MKTKWVVYLIMMLVIASFYGGCSFLPYGNTTPVLGSTPPTTAKVEYLYTYDVNANDLEDDFLTYSLLTSPEGMTIDSSTGVITWTPTEEQIGGNEVTVKVNDKWRWDTQAFLVTVSQIVLTSIEVIPSTMSLPMEYPSLLTLNFLIVTANYDYGPSKTIALRNCIYESSNTSIIKMSSEGMIAAISPGSATITVSYTEGDVTRNDTIDVTVTSPPTGLG
jgi:hypothetical protein